MKTLIIKDPDKVEDVIQNSDICFVGMVNEENHPYVIPMNFGYHEGIFYLHSAPEGKHIDCIENNSHICITLCSDRKIAFQNKEVACSYTMKAQSVVAFCNVSFIDNPEEKIKVLNILMSHYSNIDHTYSLPAVKNVKIWKATPFRLTCKAFGVPYKETLQP